MRSPHNPSRLTRTWNSRPSDMVASVFPQCNYM